MTAALVLLDAAARIVVCNRTLALEADPLAASGIAPSRLEIAEAVLMRGDRAASAA